MCAPDETSLEPFSNFTYCQVSLSAITTITTAVHPHASPPRSSPSTYCTHATPLKHPLATRSRAASCSDREQRAGLRLQQGSKSSASSLSRCTSRPSCPDRPQAALEGGHLWPVRWHGTTSAREKRARRRVRGLLPPEGGEGARRILLLLRRACCMCACCC